MRKPIPGFTHYTIDPQGRVRNQHQKRLHPYNNPITGHATVTLYDKGRTRCATVHRLLAETHIDNEHDKAQVNHIDGDKMNNHIGNLEWATPAENQQHALRTGLRRAGPQVKYLAEPRTPGVGFVLFGKRDIEAAGFNHSNFLNTMTKPHTPTGKRRHCRGYYPSKL